MSIQSLRAGEVSAMHNDDGSVDYITETVLDLDSKPVPNVVVDGEVVKAGGRTPPQFVVMKVERKAVGWGNQKKPINVYHFVLMDGSNSLFKAVTNTGLSMMLQDDFPCVGSTVVVKNFAWIWKTSADKTLFFGIMLIKSLGWNPPPVVKAEASFESLHDSPPAKKPKIVVPVYFPVSPGPDPIPESSTTRVLAKTVLDVFTDGRIRFTKTMVDNKDECRYNRATQYTASRSDIQKGEWIKRRLTRTHWVDFIENIETDAAILRDLEIQVRARQEEKMEAGEHVDFLADDAVKPECQCQSKFGLRECVLICLPVEDICKDELFATCKNRLLGRVKTWNFGLLLPNHKRWCLYWYYAVNIYRVKGSATPLPDCLVEYIRFIYPNFGETPFCGFMSTEARAAAKLKYKFYDGPADLRTGDEEKTIVSKLSDAVELEAASSCDSSQEDEF